MEYKEQHPLDAITHTQSLSMLEALIPFVDYPLKLPLALLIKYYEIRRILDVFRSQDSLSRFGLHNTNHDPMDMLAAISGISPDIMKMLLSFSNSQADANPMDFMSMFGKNGIDPQTLSGLFSGLSNAQKPFDEGKEPADTQKNKEDGFRSNAFHYDNPDTSSFDENIQSIFSEYDLMQAEKYDSPSEYPNESHLS